MLGLFIHISYGLAILVWIVLSVLLVRHIQVLTEIRGIIRGVILSYFVLSVGLILFSFFALLWPPFDFNAIFGTPVVTTPGGGF